MKRLLLGLLIFNVLINHYSFGQKMPIDYFDEGINYNNAKDYKKAIESFKYIVRNYPKDPLYPRAFYNVGYISLIDKQYDSAIFYFKAILVSNFNEKEALGGDIMADPYTNYRHHASELISDIYYNKEMYDSSLYYFSLSDTLYPYMHFCGNEYAENDVH